MLTLSRVLPVIAASPLLLFCASEVVADDRTDVGWSYEFGVGVELEPVYTGSDVYTSEADVNLEASYQANNGHRYFISLGEIGADWAIRPSLRLRTNLEYEFGRDNADDTALAGFPDVDDTVEAQTILFWQVGQVVVGGGLQVDVLDRGKGLVGFLGAKYQRLLTPKLSLRTEIDLSFADAEHMLTEVGISDATAVVTGYRAYKPSAGFKGVSTALGLDYTLASDWSVLVAGSLEFYGSNMSDSPLIAVSGTDTTYEISLGLSKLF